MKHGYGFKFLNPYGATEYEGEDFLYPLPQPNEKWGEWIEHPSPAEPDENKYLPSGLNHIDLGFPSLAVIFLL